jgi:hypothetical protein
VDIQARRATTSGIESLKVKCRVFVCFLYPCSVHSPFVKSCNLHASQSGPLSSLRSAEWANSVSVYTSRFLCFHQAIMKVAYQALKGVCPAAPSLLRGLDRYSTMHSLPVRFGSFGLVRRSSGREDGTPRRCASCELEGLVTNRDLTCDL